EIKDVCVKSRIREELGDIDALAKSISEFGLISPVLINKNMVLISGLRRLEACKKLGHSNIQALVVNIEDENILFQLESQENLCRKPLTPAELDKGIEMKKRFALTRLRGRTFLGNIWNKITHLFRKKR
ncbi:MAG: ParB N-terminal domain-containing protein, partial [Candidatus Aminicenantes bacterium]|nr:ParB N-terminal domain-containing protein [Candidatus Aminicenantes bacterium]